VHEHAPKPASPAGATAARQSQEQCRHWSLEADGRGHSVRARLARTALPDDFKNAPLFVPIINLFSSTSSCRRTGLN